MIEKEIKIKGEELNGKVVASINTAELDLYIQHFKQIGIKCRVYTSKNDPETSYVVFNSRLDEEFVFTNFVNVNKIIGFYSSNVEVDAGDELKAVSIDKEIELVVRGRCDKKFIRGESVKLTEKGVAQFKEQELLKDFPDGIGEGVVNTMSEDGDIAFVFFTGDMKPDERPVSIEFLQKIYL